MAHCLTRDAKIVRLGEQNLLNSDDGAQPKDFNIAQIIKHPYFNKTARQHNIGLIQLDNDVAFTDLIRPACLPQSNQLSELKAVALGWGHTSAEGVASDDLLKVSLDILSNDLCIQLFEDLKIGNIAIDNNQICARGLRGGADTCAGDSGRFDSDRWKFQ